jgi:hypothetical protein
MSHKVIFIRINLPTIMHGNKEIIFTYIYIYIYSNRVKSNLKNLLRSPFKTKKMRVLLIRIFYIRKIFEGLIIGEILK